MSPPPPPSNVPIPPLTPISVPPLPSSTPSPSTYPKKARCMNKAYQACYWREFTCPIACPEQCEVDCVTCSPVCNCNRPGAVCQDPRFVGADGIAFYFHGKKGQDFSIVTDSNLHINAHFIGKRNSNMKRDFTWIQSLGILFDSHKLSITAQKTPIWDDSVDRLSLSFDFEPVLLSAVSGATWRPAAVFGVSITRSRDANSVVIEVEGNFKIEANVVPITEKDSRVHNYGVTEEDCFAHLDLGFKFYSLSGDVNGVLGQTYGGDYVSKVKMGVVMPVLGGHKEFGSSSLFAVDCAVARFNGIFNSSEGFEYGDLNCGSGMDGRVFTKVSHCCVCKIVSIKNFASPSAHIFGHSFSAAICNPQHKADASAYSADFIADYKCWVRRETMTARRPFALEQAWCEATASAVAVQVARIDEEVSTEVQHNINMKHRYWKFL
ncbi:unnamed protein product [Camellia sinensis]